MSRRLALFLLFVIMAGGPARAWSADQWVEIKSSHFSVLTDGGERRGREVALQFEQMRSVFSQLFLGNHVAQPIPLQIVAFRNERQISQFAPKFQDRPLSVAGFYQQGQDKNYIVLNLEANNSWRAVFHEYAHLLLHSTVGSALPPWFDEGFAEYFSTIKVDQKQAVLGLNPEYVSSVLANETLMPVTTLFAVTHGSPVYNDDHNHRTLFYAESWLVVNYLFSNARLKDAITYFKLTNDHVPVADAMRRAFGMEPGEFDRRIAYFFHQPGVKTISQPLPDGLEKISFVTTPISQLGTAAVLADLHLHETDYQEQAIEEFQTVLRQDPENVIAHRGLGYGFLRRGDFDTAMRHFQKAAEKDSEDWLVPYYWAMLMAQKQDPSLWPQMEKEATLVTRMNPAMADGFALLGFALMSQRKTSPAAIAYETALGLSPGNETYAVNLAELYVLQGKAEAARILFLGLQNSEKPQIAIAARSHLQEMDDSSASSQGLAAKRDNIYKTAHAEGKLVNVDCSHQPEVKFTVLTGSGTLQLLAADPAKVVVIRAESFSCGPQNRSVAVNYVEAAENGQAQIISLEIL
jgi:tetratricopeptide (TPR) repeat protein